MSWLEQYFLSCSFKLLTGWDCPGCGFQRACLHLLKGDFAASISLYPATIPLMVSFLWSIATIWLRFPSASFITKALFGFSAAIVVLSYAWKILTGNI